LPLEAITILRRGGGGGGPLGPLEVPPVDEVRGGGHDRRRVDDLVRRAALLG
jgi:hypothetical protein